MEIEESFCKLSPNNPFLDKFSVDFIEDDDNETVIDFDYNEDIETDLNHIQKVCAEDSNDIPSDQNNDQIEDSDSNTEEEEVVVNNKSDGLLMGSQLMAEKYRKNKQNCDSNDVHKKCKIEKQKEREIRVELKMELELERQHRIQFQKQLEERMSYSLRKEFEDSKQIKSLKLELLKCKQQLQTLKKSMKSVDNCFNSDISSNQTNEESVVSAISCSECKSVMKSEISMILHLINHCIEEEEFQLETQVFRLDEFTDSMIDSIRKSVSYCCPRCNLTFNSLEVYYHLYKCHTKEQPIVCNRCQVYCTHLDYWTEHNQTLHNGALNSINYVDIGKFNRKSERIPNKTTNCYPNGTNFSKKYKPNPNPYPTHKHKNYKLRSTRSRQSKASSSYESKSQSDSSRSDSPEVINLTDSPPHQSCAPPIYRPSILKPTLAVKSNCNEYECDFPDCDFKTTSKDKLDFHTSAHTNSKFKCPYCPYVGNILNDIIRHIQKSKKHDGLKVYECRDCSYGTNCLTSFREHLSNKHFDDDSDDEDITEYITDMFRNQHSTNEDNKCDS